MNDEQTTSELVGDLLIWAKALEEHHSTYTLAKTARTTADHLVALQARVDALEAAASALVGAWDFDEIGQIDGELIEPFRKETP